MSTHLPLHGSRALVDRPAQHFCAGCGAGLPRTAPNGERKLVTVLFADIKDSMKLLAFREPEDARRVLDPVLALMMQAVHRYGGVVNQVMGDGIMALFGAPAALEDHAVRACHAALRMQRLIRGYSALATGIQGISPIRIRIGLNSGVVVVRSIRADLGLNYTAVGHPTHMAARMEQIARPGSIVLSAETFTLVTGLVKVKSLGPVQIKGLSDPVCAYELVGSQCEDRASRRAHRERARLRSEETCSASLV